MAGALLLFAACVCVFFTTLRAQAPVDYGKCYRPLRGRRAQSPCNRDRNRNRLERSDHNRRYRHYIVPSLRPTEYSLSIEASGFATYVQKSVTLVADQTATLTCN